ncbi:MAG: type II toxin-antitoxin system RelE/ParE family toxin [Gemmataceae bacterium]|nr:type II toxin-antitoxin system RelE/ParE family toxin [Gemmataceae bacterium]
MFEVVFTTSAVADVRHLKKADQNVVLDAIEQQLTNEPLVETRNRKPLRPNDLSSWEVRVGFYRVFYDVDETNQKVTIKAVGWKEHNKLFIRGKEYQL